MMPQIHLHVLAGTHTFNPLLQPKTYNSVVVSIDDSKYFLDEKKKKKLNVYSQSCVRYTIHLLKSSVSYKQQQITLLAYSGGVLFL